MNPDELFRRYQELQRYVGWTEDDASRVRSLGPIVAPHLNPLLDDFYDEIQRHPNAARVLTGGAEQVARLKGTLLGWVQELFSGVYDRDYVVRRWGVGGRHAEIGLDQVYTNAALSRLRRGLLCLLQEHWPGDPGESLTLRASLNLLLDLDLAIIEDAYQAAYIARQQRTERLAAIGQVAGGIAHELRNPLNVVKTSVYYLLNAHHLTPEKSAEHLRRIERHVGVADGVITTLSNFARLPLPDRKPTLLDGCLRESLEVNTVPDTVTVALVNLEGLPPVLVDADQIRIVFDNLIRNAREAIAQGGRLTLSGRGADGFVEVDVEDTGVGITPDALVRIMEPLYSTKARGLGLGLAIVRAILDKNEGSLRVRSEAGRGTTFTVRLPAAEGYRKGSGRDLTQEERP